MCSRAIRMDSHKLVKRSSTGDLEAPVVIALEKKEDDEDNKSDEDEEKKAETKTEENKTEETKTEENKTEDNKTETTEETPKPSEEAIRAAPTDEQAVEKSQSEKSEKIEEAGEVSAAVDGTEGGEEEKAINESQAVEVTTESLEITNIDFDALSDAELAEMLNKLQVEVVRILLWQFYSFLLICYWIDINMFID